jgi:glycosyltransferase involved in cell wall biosynthesis
MKILHSGSLDVKSGGPALSTSLTIKGLLQQGIPTEIIMHPLNQDGKLITDDINIHLTDTPKEHRLAYVPTLYKTLNDLGIYNLYHIQGLWQYLSHAVACHARRTHTPYIVTLRGMLYPQALEQSGFIKKLSLLLYQRKDLQQATCIQATCMDELKYYRQLGFTNPVAVLPNPIEIKEAVNRSILPKDKIRIGYLGRVHPRKRIERLIYVFDRLREDTKDCELLIIGADNKPYEKFLRQEVERLHLSNVKFTGFLIGKEMDDAINSLSYLVLPSDFENFGNIVTEALVRGIPVIASKGTPWEELNTHNCGWWVDNDVDTLATAIEKAIHLPEEERTAMGKRGQELIKNNYSVEVVSKKMVQLYDWILNGGEKPEFVYG